PAVSSLEAFRTPASVHPLAPAFGRHPKTLNDCGPSSPQPGAGRFDPLRTASASSQWVYPLGTSTSGGGKRAGSCRSGAFNSDPSQLDVIGYFAKISSTRLNAFSAAACGVARS